MAFVLNRTNNFTITVMPKVAIGAITEIEKHQLTVERISSEEFDSLVRGRNGTVNVLRRVVRGWDHVLDDAGAPLPFTPENFAAYLTIPVATQAAFKAYFERLTGVVEGN